MLRGNKCHGDKKKPNKIVQVKGDQGCWHVEERASFSITQGGQDGPH